MKNIIRNIFLCFIYYNPIITSLIILPIYSNLSRKENNITFEELKENNFEKIYKTGIYTNIGIGDPEQIIPTLISLKNSHFFISNRNINGTYIKEKSLSFKFIENPPKQLNWYHEDFETTILCQDNFNFKDLRLNKRNYVMSFFLVNSLNKNIYYKNYIGLAPSEKGKLNNISFLYQLKEKEYIFSNVFTFNFDKSKNNGKIIIGSFPHEYEPDNYKIDNLKIIGKEFFKEWIINFNYFSIINNTIEKNMNNSNDIIFELEKKIHFKVNFENYILLPKELSQEFDKIIQSIYKNNCTKYDLEYLKYTYICNDNINIKDFPIFKLSLKIQKITFELDYSDLFYKINNTYFLLIKLNNGDLRYGEIGLPFLSKYQLIFHEKDLFIGYYLKNNNKEFPIIKTILVTSIFINIIFISLYIRRYFKRKNVKKFDYSYIEQNTNDNFI